MTLKGHKSHYNIKLLRGYGVSINHKNNQIILKNGQNHITGESEKAYSFKHGLKMENGKSMCQEIIIAKITVQNLANYCVRNNNIYV